MRTEAFRAGTGLSFPEMGVLNFSYSLSGSQEERHDSYERDHRYIIIYNYIYI